MSVPAEDIALAAEKLSDDEVIVTLLETVSHLDMVKNPQMSKRFEDIKAKYKARIPLRRKLEANPEIARELIADYSIYASISGIKYSEMVDICVALDLDEVEEK